MDRFWGSQAGVVSLVLAAVLLLGVCPSPSRAMHETDHRFTVEGHVCDEAGRPVSGTQVIVKDVRVSEGASGYTDDAGYYKAVLHLHNDNVGDRILVTVGDQERQVTAQFDPKDVHSERKVTVNFGSGCERGEASQVWLYYTVGVGVLALVLVVGGAVWKRQRRARKRGKRQRR